METTSKKSLIDASEVYLKSDLSIYVREVFVSDNQYNNKEYKTQTLNKVTNNNESIIMKTTRFLTLGIWS